MRSFDKEQVKNNVFMENTIRQIVNHEARKLHVLLSEFSDDKVTKADGSFLKKIQDRLSFEKDVEIKPLTDDGYAGVGCIYTRITDYSIQIIANISWNGGTYQHEANYDPANPYYHYQFEQSAYLAEFVTDGVRHIKVMKLGDLSPMPMLFQKAEEDHYAKAIQLKEELDEELRQIKISRHRESVR
jgi:hypothetical protein